MAETKAKFPTTDEGMIEMLRQQGKEECSYTDRIPPETLSVLLVMYGKMFYSVPVISPEWPHSRDICCKIAKNKVV